MIRHFFDSKSGLTGRQKDFINKHRTVKKKGVRGAYTGNIKSKYWCKEKNDWYLATSRHIHCRLCYNADTGKDKHEIIKFNPRVHKL